MEEINIGDVVKIVNYIKDRLESGYLNESYIGLEGEVFQIFKNVDNKGRNYYKLSIKEEIDSRERSFSYWIREEIAPVSYDVSDESELLDFIRRD